MKTKNVILSVLAGIFVIFCMLGIYTVRSGSVAVLSTFGKYSKEVQEPGLHFKIPFIQQATLLDVKMQTVNYQGEDAVDRVYQQGLISKPKIIVLDSKNLAIGIEVTMQFSPIVQDAESILTLYGQNYFEKLMNPIFRDVVRNVAGQYQAEEIAIQRSAIGAEFAESLRGKMEGLPFVLNAVQIRNIDLPSIVRKKIEEVQLAKQEEQRLAMIEKQAEKNQLIKSIEAKTRLIEITTQAKADAEKQCIEADAKAYRIAKEAEALAAANKEIGASVTPQLIEYQAIQQWNGKYPTTLFGGGGNQPEFMVQLPRMGHQELAQAN